MSGWIKWEKDLESDPRVLRMARELKRLCNAPAFNPVTLVCGGLIRLWGFADTHIRDDDTLDLGISELDELIGISGFCSLMPEDWLRAVDERTVELPGFQAHNGVEARKKALTQKRVETHRKRKSVTKTVTAALTSALPDQDQTRPDQKKTNGNHAVVPTDVSVVFDHWKQTHNHPQSKLDDKRIKLIRVALKSYAPEQLCAAIGGYRNSPYHMGKNQNKTVYDDIGLFLRDNEHIDAGLKFAEQGSATQWQ
jgi:hypothetical protein